MGKNKKVLNNVVKFVTIRHKSVKRGFTWNKMMDKIHYILLADRIDKIPFLKIKQIFLAIVYITSIKL